MASPSRGILIIISGPSGSGKSTLVKEVFGLGRFPLVYSISATSRPPRPGEVQGKDYRFLSREEFERKAAEGEFLELAEVHGNLYGTPRAPVERELAAGRWIVLEIDVQGHRQVKKLLPEAVSFFVRAPSDSEYFERLRDRGTDSPEVIARRVANAKAELVDAATYDFQVVNETVEQATRILTTLLAGVAAERGLTDVR